MNPSRRPASAEGDIFVAHDDGSFTCSTCTPMKIDLADPNVEVWEVGSHGWTGPVVCRNCKLRFEIYIDGNDTGATNALPSKDRT